MKFDTQTTASDVHAAMELWQAFEYLSPQSPPAPKRESNVCVWAIPNDRKGDSEMPWICKAKQHDLTELFEAPPEKRQFVLYAGILPGRVYTNAARELLNVAAIEDEEARGPGDAASLVLPIDSNGYAAGLPFISSTPWALGSLTEASKNSKRFNFRGFFGEKGVQKQAIKEIQELLVKRKLLPASSGDGKGAATVGELLNQAYAQTQAECKAKDLNEDQMMVQWQKAAKEIRSMYQTVVAEDIQELTKAVFSFLGWFPSQENPWIIETKFLRKKERDDPLNSFYAEDLETVQSAISAGNFGSALKQFLSNQESLDRIDIDKDQEALISGVHPSKLPLAAWPGTYPLVTAQQFAVNTIFSELAVDGIYSVNGPPGTGKTTMLKDIVASVIQQRADIILAFNHPMDAFKKKLTIENYRFPAWQLDPSLRGFGIVVSSANNGAVENISRELPGLSTVDKSITLDYFSQVSDSLALKKGERRPTVQQTWGLISGALGNSTNRSLFTTNFWWGDRNSKKPLNGSPDPLAPVPLPKWIEEYGRTVPSWNQAQARYRQARAKAVEAIATASELVDKMQMHADLQAELDELQQLGQMLRKKVADAESHLEHAEKNATATNAAHRLAQTKLQLMQSFDRAAVVIQKIQSQQISHQNSKCAHYSPQALDREIDDAGIMEKNAQTRVNNHLSAKPGTMWRFFARKAAKEWDTESNALQRAIAEAQVASSKARTAKNDYAQWLVEKTTLATEHTKAKADETFARNALINKGFSPQFSLRLAEDEFKRCTELKDTHKALAHDAEVQMMREQASLQGNLSRQQDVSHNLATLQHELARKNLADGSRSAWNLRKLTRNDLHKSAPYQDDEELFSARRDLFVAAMELHQSFVVESWQKLKPTLAAFINHLQGQISAKSIEGGPMQLWDAFFLTVPLISTSFASFPRLFKGVGADELAWALIDEAGQATPQQAVGAIWRSKRIVIVGDPIQLEPVVGISQELVEPLKIYCGTPDKYVPPDASVQTIADRSNRYGTLMGESDPATAIWLGSPLTVHRRCLNPMFDIANSIAYEDKMVYGTSNDPNFPALPSQWIDAQNNDAQGHWIASQGRIVLDLIDQLTNNHVLVNGKFRLYVITPFKLVAQNMRAMLEPVVGKDAAAEMCGTVHTFQGKEADFVIFLLAGDPHRRGVVSSFAGRKPNLVNVAVTRAKKRLYVVGNREFWCSNDSKGYFQTMNTKLEETVRP